MNFPPKFEVVNGHSNKKQLDPMTRIKWILTAKMWTIKKWILITNLNLVKSSEIHNQSECIIITTTIIVMHFKSIGHLILIILTHFWDIWHVWFQQNVLIFTCQNFIKLSNYFRIKKLLINQKSIWQSINFEFRLVVKPGRTNLKSTGSNFRFALIQYHIWKYST